MSEGHNFDGSKRGGGGGSSKKGGGSSGGGGLNLGSDYPELRACRAKGCYFGKKTCKKCDAKGVVAHKKCLGTGYFPIGTSKTCWGCNGLGDVQCNKCGGHGEYDCECCGGTGAEYN